MAYSTLETSTIDAVGVAGEPLARHTTMRVGGAARWWVEAGDEATLADALREAKQRGLPLQVIGAGSNLIARDEGFDGLVLKLGSGFAWQRVEGDRGDRLRVGGATYLPRLTKVALENRLGNMEWACGIPGSVGGSIWGNAGARGFNGQEWEGRDAAADLWAVVAFDRSGRRHELQRGDIDFAYRRSSLGDMIVTEAEFRLKPLTPEQVTVHRQAVRELLRRRRETQPVNAACAGCIWKNPQVVDCAGAGQLIERLGLKGHRVGHACISGIHANFIVNEGGASAADVFAVMHAVEQVVREQGVELEREVRVI